jgi:hypothetical protein
MELHENLVWLKAHSRSALSFGLVALATTLGCSPGSDTGSTYGPPPECDAGDACITTGATMTSGSGGQGGSGGSGGSGQGGGTVTGTVHEITDPLFKMSQTYLGAATILVDGTNTMVPYNGATSDTFSIPDVPAGDQWFFVQDDTAGTSGIYSTYSLVNAPPPGPLTLPVVQRTLLETIMSTLPISTSPVPDRAHAVLTILRNAQPVSGVRLDILPVPSDDVAYYDDATAGYSNLASATGATGILLILNIPATDPLLTIHLVDANQAAFMATIRVAPNAVTMTAIDI